MFVKWLVSERDLVMGSRVNLRAVTADALVERMAVVVVVVVVVMRADHVFEVRRQVRLAQERGRIGQVSAERLDEPIEIADATDRLGGAQDRGRRRRWHRSRVRHRRQQSFQRAPASAVLSRFFQRAAAVMRSDHTVRRRAHEQLVRGGLLFVKPRGKTTKNRA